MSHIQCPKCHSREHFSGYGMGMGPLGQYTVCECDMILEMVPDVDGLTDEQAAAQKAWADRLLRPYREALRAFVEATEPYKPYKPA